MEGESEDKKLKEVKEKTKVFFKNQTFIFIKAIKDSGNFELRNGVIKEMSADFFIMVDYKTGRDIPVFFNEIIREGAIFEPSRCTDFFENSEVQK